MGHTAEFIFSRPDSIWMIEIIVALLMTVVLLLDLKSFAEATRDGKLSLTLLCNDAQRQFFTFKEKMLNSSY